MEIYEGEFKGFTEQSGTSTSGKAWTKVTCLVQNMKDEYCRAPVPFTTFFQKNIDAIKSLQIGSVVKITYNLRGNEYNGKYYTEAALEIVDVLDTPMDIMPPMPQQQNPLQIDDNEDLGLPF